MPAGEKSIRNVAIGYIIISILQSFAFAQSNNNLYNRSIGWTYHFVIVGIILYALFINSKKKNLVIDSSRVLLAFSFFVSWFLAFIHSYGQLNLFSIIQPVVLSVFLFSCKAIFRECYSIFHTIFFCLSICGIISFLLYVFNILPPFSIVDFYEEEENAYYMNYILAYILQPGLPRLCGMYNEPGLFGTLGALLLVSEQMKMNFKNIIILVACILTFSVAFVVLIMLYLLFQAFLKRSIKTAAFLSLVVLLIGYASTMDFGDSELYRFFGRFVFEDGALSGDRRMKLENTYLWDRVINDPQKLWFGYGSFHPDTQVSSYKKYIMLHGIVGTVIIFLPMLIGLLKFGKGNKYCVILVILFFLNIYQRPQVFDLSYFILIIGGIQHILHQQETNYLKHNSKPLTNSIK